MLILFVIRSVLSSGLDNIGRIHPSGLLSLYMSITNQLEIADYTFIFTLDHSIPSLSLVKVDFPSQYSIGLNITKPLCSLGPCEVSDRTVTITLPSLLVNSKSCTLVIYSVGNPPLSGGTGNFAISTWIGSNLIDANKVFGVVGISESPGNLASATVSVVSGGSTYAGDIANYQFMFTLSRDLQAWDWIRFTFPSTYNLAAYPYCSAFYVESSFIPGIMSCSTTGTSVLMTGISSDLSAGSQYGVYISANNPPFSGVTGTFMIETGRNSTYTVLDRRSDIAGVTINPGIIQDISLEPYKSTWNITRNKIILYRLQFLLKNPIDQGGTISIQFSNSFNMDYTLISEIEYGLNDISRASPAIMTYDISKKILTVSSFSSFTPILISLLLEINNPNDAGPTNPLIISSYLSSSILVDQDTSTAYVTVLTYSSPTSTSITYPGPTGAQATGLTTTIGINITPQVQVPQLGYIRVNIPTGFDFTGSPTCQLQPTNMLLQSSPYCNYLDNVLTVQLYATTGSNSGSFLPTVSSLILLSNIVAPDKSGWYLFDFNTNSQVWDFLESGLATAIMVASDFSFFAADVVASGINSPTVLMIKFVNSKVIPVGVVPYITTELQGGIEVLLPTMDASGNLLFPLDLGLGAVVGSSLACMGMSGIDTELYCFVSYVPSAASSTDNIVLTIWNFTEIAVNSYVTVHIPGIHYTSSAGSPSITVNTYSNYNRIRSYLETGQATLTIGTAAPASSPSAVGLSLYPTIVNSTSVLSTSGLLPLTSATTSSTPYLLIIISPTHEQGYCRYSSPKCSINGILYLCTCYPVADIILVYLTSNIISPYSVSISGIINPETVNTVQDSLIVYLIDSYVILQSYTFAGLPFITPGTILNPYITLSDRGQGYVNTMYVLQITPEHYMIENGYVLISFGPEYTLSRSSPASTCYTRYLSESTVCAIKSNTLTISGYKPTNTIFLVYVQGVKNPSVPKSSQFTCIVYSSTGLIIDSYLNIPGITFEGVWNTLDLEYVRIINTPSNANSTSDYRISFTPCKYLGVGGYIDIVFPYTQFGVLPSPVRCLLVGYVNTRQRCEVYNNKLRVVIDTAPPFKILSVDVLGLLNFPQGDSGSFSISTVYDGVVLQANSDPVIVSTSYQLPVLNVNSLAFYPQNEGEQATYTITLTPQFNIPSSAVITVRFPQEYDQSLGNSIKCTSEDLSGRLNCTQTSAYTISIFNFDVYFICDTCTITLHLYGIINPNYINQPTGQFCVGIYNNGAYQEINEYSGNAFIVPAGDYIDIILLSHNNLDSGTSGYMEFNISTSITIPSTDDGGAVWITFPSQYPLLTNNFYCTSSSYWALGVPDCNLYMDTIIANAQTEEYYGNLFVNIENLPYPWTEVLADYITLKVYDGVNYKILSRTYSNLSPTRLSYKYAGPLIVINHSRSFSVSSGTMSSFIPVTLDYPCALNLTLIPIASGFTIDPYEINLQIGDVYSEFRVSAPLTIENGLYYIYWTTYGEIEPLYYVPIIPTAFYVTTDTVEVFIETPSHVPRGGRSLPVLITLANAPDSDFIVSMSLQSNDPTIYISDESLEFIQGQYSQNFTISVHKDCSAVSGRIFFSISGTNVDSYALPFLSVDFRIFDNQDVPSVLTLALTGVTGTTANFTISANKICLCYYAYAYAGTQPPSFYEVMVQGPPPYFTTNTNYGMIRLSNYKQTNIAVNRLTKQTQYALYVWLQDLSSQNGLTNDSIISSNCSVLEFKTDNRHKAAELTLYYDSTYLTNDDIDLALSTITLLLSLDSWRVLLNTISVNTQPSSNTSPSSQHRSLSQITSSLTFYILDTNYNENYPKPIEMISLLASKSGKLKNILNNFDTNTEIKGVEIYLNDCAFQVYPSVVDVNNRNATVQACLVEDGAVYAVLTESLQEPYAFQVFFGLDSSNRPTPYDSASLAAGVPGNLTFSDLSPQTNYTLYLICTNNYPGYPDLLSDANLVKLTWNTLPDPALPSLYIDYSQWISISLMSIAMLLII